jgi:hypothetical protein
LARNVNTKFAAHAALPLALLLAAALAQGGSCGKGAAGANAAKGSKPAASKASNAAADAVAATTPAGAPTSNAAVAGANSNAGGGGMKDVAAVNKMSETTGGGGDVAAGSWGGQHVRLEVGPDGAEIEFDCAHGRINARLRPGRDGRFDAAGTFVAERGGPVREGASEKGEPARYTGRVKGKTMTLSVRLTDSNTDVGTFTLTHGREPELVKCR